MAELTNEHWCSGMPGYRGRVSIATGPLSPRPPACPSIVVCGLGSTADNTMLLPTTPPGQESNRASCGSERSCIYTMSNEGNLLEGPELRLSLPPTLTPGPTDPSLLQGAGKGEGRRKPGSLSSTPV